MFMLFMDLDHLFEPSLNHSLHSVRPSCVAWDAVSEQSWLSKLWRTPAKKQMPTEPQAGLRNPLYTFCTLGVFDCGNTRFSHRVVVCFAVLFDRPPFHS